MSRPLVLGNGSILVGFDKSAQIRDFYFDYVGLDNHMDEDSIHKVGVWVDGTVSWLDSPDWNLTIKYLDDTLCGDTTAVNENLNLKLNFIDLVYNEKNILLRQLTIHNLAKTKRNIKVFFNYQFRMYGVKKGDTVYFDPEDHTIVHYKGRRTVIIGGLLEDSPFSDYSVGLSNIEGKAGTWMDAEDGVLSKNPIEHGIVDSTIGFESTVDSGKSFILTNWVVAGKSLTEAKDLHKYIIKKSPAHLIESTQDYWNAWVNKQPHTFSSLKPEVIDLYNKSLLIMRTHVDNTGAIIASGDSEMLQFGRDNYSYIWPRDGAYIAIAFDKAGYPEVARKFFQFCADVISEEGYFYHKYRSDKSTGSSWHPWIFNGNRQLPIQEDETALVIYALWSHYQYSKDLEFIEAVYNSLIKKAGDFMLGFRNESRLPYPSYDIWEMKFGIHTYTAASVYGALIAVSNFAHLLGKDKDEELFKKGAEEVKSACTELLYNPASSFFYKFIDFQEGQILHDETIDVSSFYGMYHFGVLNLKNKMLTQSAQALEKHLLCQTKTGGIVRFEGDKYYQVDPQTPGNPWIVTTLWYAQYLIDIAKNRDDLDKAVAWLEWVTRLSLPSGILSEQINPHTGEQISASPLIWSHAEYVTTIINYLERVQDLGRSGDQ